MEFNCSNVQSLSCENLFGQYDALTRHQQTFYSPVIPVLLDQGSEGPSVPSTEEMLW